MPLAVSSVTPLTGVLPASKERALIRLSTIFFEPMLAPPGPIQPHELSEFGTMCSPSSTATPSTVLTCAALNSVQASPGPDAAPEPLAARAQMPQEAALAKAVPTVLIS